jgi:hypothetical protein
MNPGVHLARGRWNPGFICFGALRNRIDHDLVTRD